jgi:AcrR family transcriptional regulator
VNDRAVHLSGDVNPEQALLFTIVLPDRPPAWLTAGSRAAILTEYSMNMRQQQAEHRRLQLIDSALDVFAAKGVDGATVKDLSEAAGVAQGLLYHYFRSKQELFQAVLERHYFLPELRRIAELHGDRPAGEVLLEVALGFARMLDQHRLLVQLLMREAPSNPALMQRFERSRREGVDVLAEFLDERVASGELRAHDTHAAARLLMYAVVGAHLANTPPEPFLPTSVELMLRGLRP